MLTGELRIQIDGIWNDFWFGRARLQVIEQITYLQLLKRIQKRLPTFLLAPLQPTLQCKGLATALRCYPAEPQVRPDVSTHDSV